MLEIKIRHWLKVGLSITKAYKVIRIPQKSCGCMDVNLASLKMHSICTIPIYYYTFMLLLSDAAMGLTYPFFCYLRNWVLFLGYGIPRSMVHFMSNVDVEIITFSMNFQHILGYIRI